MHYRLVNGKVPAYVGVYNALYSDITNGVYLENEALPGEVALANRYGVSRNTLRQAMAILSEDGLILRAQGKGTLVAPRNGTLPAGKISNLMISCAREHITNVQILYNYGPPTDIARAKLGLPRSELVLAGDAVYRTESSVAGYSFTQVVSSVFNDLEVDLAEEASVERLITTDIFSHAEMWNLTIKLVLANEMEAEFLEVEESTPLHLFEAILYGSTHRPFARCKFYFLPEHYLLQFHM